MLSVVKMPLKGEVGGHALKSHGNNIVDHGKSWNVFLNFCGNPELKEISEAVILLTQKHLFDMKKLS